MSIENLRNEILGINQISEEYKRKMCHQVPDAPVVDRVKFILERCKEKTVLNLGCASGDLHKIIGQVTRSLHGIDKVVCGHAEYAGCERFDLDDIQETELPWFNNTAFDLVVIGEVLEHLGNPGFLLHRLHQYQAPLLITVPNCFSVHGTKNMQKGVENVNIAHTMWFSWRTLKTLVERYNYDIKEWAWYHGDPLFAEGLVFVVR